MEISKDVNTYFRKHGIQPSFQRLKIFEYLFNHKNHPTADTIFKDLSAKIPTLSKTTVYNTLKLFLEKDMAQAITISGGETRYDVDMKLHGHFKCDNCGNVFDFETELPSFQLDQMKDFDIQEYHIYFKGTCNRC